MAFDLSQWLGAAFVVEMLHRMYYVFRMRTARKLSDQCWREALALAHGEEGAALKYVLRIRAIARMRTGVTWGAMSADADPRTDIEYATPPPTGPATTAPH